VTFADEGVEDAINLLQLTVARFRSQLAALNITKNQSPVIYIRCNNPSTFEIFSKETEVFKSLIRSGEVTILDKNAGEPDGCINSYINDELSIYVKVVGLIDINLEIERVNKRNAQLADLKDKLEKKC